MSKVAVVTDTDSSLPAAVAGGYGIRQVPIAIHFGEQSFETGIDIDDAGAFARMGKPAKSEVLMVGDSLTSDIRGGFDYGIDTCWYNPAGLPLQGAATPTYEIRRLDELLSIVH